MSKRIAFFLGIFASTVAARAAADAGDDEGSGSDDLVSSATTTAQLFAGVDDLTPVCFGKSYAAAHLASHPKQTVKTVRVELYKAAPAYDVEDAIRISFQRTGPDGPKTRQLSCKDDGGRVLCDGESGHCKSTVELRTAPDGGLRVVNRTLRAAGACDADWEPLDATAGADDVFDLPKLGSCAEGDLANIPMISCERALETQHVRTCIDVFLSNECPAESQIHAGERWSDEYYGTIVSGARAESEDECVQRFSDIAAEDGCCGG